MTIIVVKNWEKFQHYGNREPTWIKLYRDMLTSEAWVLGTDLSRLVQVAITLLAARYQNATPYQFGLIKKVTSLDCKEKDFRVALDFLAKQNFLEIQQRTNGAEHVEHSASSVLAPCYDREEEDRKERKDKKEEEIRQDMSDSKQSDVEVVFSHWRQVHNHLRAQLDAKRRTLIEERLREYGMADLCTSISGFLNSPHHMGQNDRGMKYDDIELFLRDAKHVDMGLKAYAEPPLNQSTLTRKNVAATDGWLPPEMRNAKH